MMSFLDSNFRPSLLCLCLSIFLVNACFAEEKQGFKPLPKGKPKVGSVGKEKKSESVKQKLSLEKSDDFYLLQFHRLWISGDVKKARRGFETIVGQVDRRPKERARAALLLARIADWEGKKRESLSWLDRVRYLVPEKNVIAAHARDLRAQLINSLPFADIRGPMPNAFALVDSKEIRDDFKQAEQLLIVFHRYVAIIAKIESFDRLQRNKLFALNNAKQSYIKVIEKSEKAFTKAAAFYRIATLHHRFAENLSSDLPKELLPKLAIKLRAKLKKMTRDELLKAQNYYEKVLNIDSKDVKSWKMLAKRQADTLKLVLRHERSAKR